MWSVSLFHLGGKEKKKGPWRQKHCKEVKGMEMLTLIEPAWSHSLAHLAWAHKMWKSKEKGK